MVGRQGSYGTEVVSCVPFVALVSSQPVGRRAHRIDLPCADLGGRHPLLFSANYRDEILNHYDQVGLRGLLQAHADDVAEVEVSTPEVLEDIDSAEDYQRMRSRFLEQPMRDTTTGQSEANTGKTQ